jgi:hypothetical protein
MQSTPSNPHTPTTFSKFQYNTSCYTPKSPYWWHRLRFSPKILYTYFTPTILATCNSHPIRRMKHLICFTVLRFKKSSFIMFGGSCKIRGKYKAMHFCLRVYTYVHFIVRAFSWICVTWTTVSTEKKSRLYMRDQHTVHSEHNTNCPSQSGTHIT